MNTFTKSISDIFKRALSAFMMYPASIGSAIIFAIIVMIRIFLDWPEQESYNFLFNCLQWAFAVGSIWGLTLTVAARTKKQSQRSLLYANLMIGLMILLTFVLLFTLGMAKAPFKASRYDVLSTLAIARVSITLLVGFLSFIELMSFPRAKSDFSRALFMTQKAFFIAMIYGLVLLLGSTGVATAIQNLLFPGMSEKVYMYISTLVGFIAFTIFVGYFPNEDDDSRREITQKQPQFIEILFGYILIPIFFAMTLVLFAWSIKTFTTKTWPIFIELSSITFTYTLGGIWLHLMVTHHETPLANNYKRFYPFAALIILTFEARALFAQLSKFGLKTTEYYFILLWIVTVITAILLIIKKEKAHDLFVKMICVTAILSVLPFVGYHKIPVAMQVERLQHLLTEQNMLIKDEIVPAANDPESNVKEAITDAVMYLSYSESADLPVWFDTALSDQVTFKNKMGFEQTWPKIDLEAMPVGYTGISLVLPTSVVNISEYEYMFTFDEAFQQTNPSASLTTDQGVYQIYWNVNERDQLPGIKVLKDDVVIIEQTMSSRVDELMGQMSSDKGPRRESTFEDMSVLIENDEVKLLIVFRNIEIFNDGNQINYWFNLSNIYFHEK